MGVQEKLMISYEALDAPQKQMFLDIARLVNGEDLRIASYMWHEFSTSHLSGGSEYRHLLSLIKIRDDNELWMHDELRELGRQLLACQCGVTDFQMEIKPQTTWRDYGMFEGVKGKEKVGDLIPRFDDLAPYEDMNTQGMTGVRFLNVEDASINRYDAFPDLRWLQLHRCPQNCKEAILFPKSLVILDVSWSNITESWEGWGQIKMVETLRVLNLTGCNHLITTPNFSGFPDLKLQRLEEIHASYCRSLTKFIPSDSYNVALGSLMSLKTLRLGFSRISELPENFRDLPRLETLDLLQCNMLRKLPVLPSSMTSLRYTCKGMEKPRLFGLDNLKEVLLADTDTEELICREAGSTEPTFRPDGGLPMKERKFFNGFSLDGCPKLRIIEFCLSWVTEIYLPSSPGVPHSLKKVVLSCVNLECVPAFPPTLISLTFQHCWSLKSARLGGLKALEELYLDHSAIIEILDLHELQALVILKLSHCRVEHLEGLKELTSLRSLTISHCDRLSKLPDLSNLEALVELHLDNSAISQISGLSNLQALEILKVSHCRVKHLEGLEELTSLRSLIVFHCDRLSKLPDLSKLKVSDCRALEQLEGLLELTSIRSLTVFHFDRLSKLPDLSKLEPLVELHVDYSVISNIAGLFNLKALEILKVSHCRVEHLEGLEELTSLRSLTVSHCDGLSKLPDLSKLNDLRDLNLDNSVISQISGLSNLQALEILKVSGCRALEHLEGLQELTSLRSLTVSDCDGLSKLPDLSKLNDLRDLNLDNSAISHISGLSNIQALEILKVSGCRALEHLEGLQELTSLRRLIVSHCDGLSKLPDLSKLKRLSVSDIPGGSDD
ncbi:hypothetical protein CRG98_018949 [Punica granatum]|uniref:R13L1/DRL21-like LRR repeat region domain-containing protein n=1 Tax=Punica granatum TaxID=22663 RepID=A0A2I0JWF5_PUNGR|nr:hypothetical protein CRG98_018949 [Punica granatum]